MMKKYELLENDTKIQKKYVERNYTEYEHYRNLGV